MRTTDRSGSITIAKGTPARSGNMEGGSPLTKPDLHPPRLGSHGRPVAEHIRKVVRVRALQQVIDRLSLLVADRPVLGVLGRDALEEARVTQAVHPPSLVRAGSAVLPGVMQIHLSRQSVVNRLHFRQLSIFLVRWFDMTQMGGARIIDTLLRSLHLTL